MYLYLIKISIYTHIYIINILLFSLVFNVSINYIIYNKLVIDYYYIVHTLLLWLTCFWIILYNNLSIN